MDSIEKVKSQWNALSESDKRLIRFYRQLDHEQILQRIERFGTMTLGEVNEKRTKEFQHQVTLYSIAYLLNQHKINGKGGGKTRRTKARGRRTRRRRG